MDNHAAATMEAPDKNYIKCTYCNKTFANKNSESKHRIRTHGEYVGSKKSVPCKENDCGKQVSSLCLLRKHLETDHNFEGQNDCEEKTLKLMEEFHQWLAIEERNTKSQFISARGERQEAGYTQHEFICNRSLNFKSKSTGKRQLKSQGSRKIGFHCTAQIIVQDYKCHLIVKYFKKHYKHDSYLGHTSVPKEIKKSIAGKLLIGVTEKRILTDVRGPVPLAGEEERNNVVTNTDIRNIKRNILGTRIARDEISVHMWVKAMREKGNIIYYKEQNSPHEEIDQKDFFLVFLMPIQMKMLSVFGGDRICIDSTHGTTGYGFELVTLMVIDEFEEGFPAAFCLTSTVNFKTLVYFFKIIKSTLPDIAEVEVFMSDDAAFFYNAWESVFGPAKNRLLCAWHVDRAWHGHLQSVPKEKRDKVYQVLKSLVYELDMNSFYLMLNNFMYELEEDEETHAFFEYFKKYYLDRTAMWAYCHRKGAKLNTIMHVEHFHKELKHEYLEGKKCKRVDKCCESLEAYIIAKQFDRLTKIHKGKITKKETLAYKRHKEGKNIMHNSLQVTETKWVVQSSTFKEENYTVEKIHDCTADCVIQCRECFCCRDAYKCSCHDYCILNNICKHIHSIIIVLKHQNSLQSSEPYTGPLYVPSESFLPSNDVTSNSISVVVSKEKILEKYNVLYAKTASKENLDDLICQQIMESLKTVEQLLDIEVPERSFPCVPRESANKRIVPQQRFHNVKKERLKKKRLSKPTTEEQCSAKRELLNEPIVMSSSCTEHQYL